MFWFALCLTQHSGCSVAPVLGAKLEHLDEEKPSLLAMVTDAVFLAWLVHGVSLGKTDDQKVEPSPIQLARVRLAACVTRAVLWQR
eukprot:313695-Amphidinium_carterae.1